MSELSTVIKYGLIPGILLIGVGAFLFDLGTWPTLPSGTGTAVCMLLADYLLRRHHRAGWPVGQNPAA